MSTLKWLSDVVQNKRNPHWFFLLLPSLGAALGLHVYLLGIDLAPFTPPASYNSSFALVALPFLVFVGLFTGLLMFFNGRAINADYPIVVSERGVLSYEEELHIALRVETLKNLVHSFAESVTNKEDVRRILFESGEFAGADFGEKFPKIYLRELQEGKQQVSWDALTLQTKFELWRAWDRGVGWGIFTAIDEGRGNFSVQNHHVSMYSGRGGALVASMIAGYMVGVMNALTGSKLRAQGEPALTRDSVLIRLSK